MVKPIYKLRKDLVFKIYKEHTSWGKDKEFRFTMSEDPEVLPESLALSVKSGLHHISRKNTSKP